MDSNGQVAAAPVKGKVVEINVTKADGDYEKTNRVDSDRFH